MDEKEFFERLKENKIPVVVDFWAPWCGPCKSLEPLLKKVGQFYAGRVEVWKVNVEESQELKTTLKILGLPTLIVYRDGKEVTRCTGAASTSVLNLLFEAALSGIRPTQPMYKLRERFMSMMLDFSRLISRKHKHSSSDSGR